MRPWYAAVGLLATALLSSTAGADSVTDASTCGAGTALAVAPSRTRRLTRDEYAHTVAALFPGVEFAGAFPPDDKVAGFIGNAQVLVTDSHSRTYQELAEELTLQVVARLPDLLPVCARGGEALDERACLQVLTDRVGRRLYRRPLDSRERRAYAALFAGEARARGTLAGVSAVIEAMLQSVHFLYRIETGVPAPQVGPGIARLGDFELATRLAFLLWNAGPDDDVLDQAAAGRLHATAHIEAQARRMLRDPRARVGLRHVYEQIFRLEKTQQAGKSNKDFPEFGDDLRASMLGETRAFLDHVLWAGHGNLETLLTARFSFVDAALARLYGLPEPTATGFALVSFPEALPRAGLLTQASFLAGHASATKTSIVQRGLTIRESLLCQELPPPPPGTDMNPSFDRLEKQPCKSCHTMMDPLGQGLERYDPIGRYRSVARGKPIEEAGLVIRAAGITPEFRGAVELGQKIAASEQFRACNARQWFRYAIGREESDRDACAVATLKAVLDGAGGDVREMIVAVTALPQFRFIRSEEVKADRVLLSTRRGRP